MKISFDFLQYCVAAYENALKVPEQLDKPLLIDLLTDVYRDMPTNLKEQTTKAMKKHPQDYHSGFVV